MEMTPAAAEEIREAIEILPAPAYAELAQFIDYLKFKYGRQEATNVALEGLWAGVDFRITQEDVRRLRERISTQLIQRLADDESPG